MATIINNPFNNQPVQTVVSTSNYTVPAGKYARVNIGNAMLPVLNSVNMYVTKTITSQAAFTTAPASAYALSNLFAGAKNVHRINQSSATNATWYLGINNGYAAQGNLFGFTGVSTNIMSMATWSGTTGSLILPSPTDVLGITISSSSASAVSIGNISVDCCNSPTELWLKAGDVLTFSAGNIIYTEYNIIS